MKRLGWIPSYNSPWGDIVRDHTARSHDGFFSDGNAAQNGHIAAD